MLAAPGVLREGVLLFSSDSETLSHTGFSLCRLFILQLSEPESTSLFPFLLFSVSAPNKYKSTDRAALPQCAVCTIDFL